MDGATSETPSMAPPSGVFGFVRRMYDWVLSWAESRFAVAALALISAAESSVFPLPPDILLIAMCIGQRTRAWYFAAVTSVGSIIGGCIGYLIGHSFWGAVQGFFYSYVPGVNAESYATVQQLYQEWDFWLVFTAGFTPLPYKLITITAGVFEIPFGMFVVASAISRSARFFLVAGLIWRFGAPIREFIDKYFNLLTLVFGVLFVGGFVVLKYVF